MADFDPTTNILTVAATSGDTRVPPTLTVREYNSNVGTPIVTTAPPGTVTVLSSAGGSDTAKVRVVAATAPSAPTGLVSTAATAQTVTLNWTDTSTNETGFNIYTVSAGGIRSLVGTAAANATTATVSGLAVATAFTFQVDAFNTVGAASSNTVIASTLALPVAPSAVVASLSTTAQRAINVSWADNSTDETSFQILRATAVGGPYAQVATAAAGVGTGVVTIADVSGPPAVSTTYFYQVVAVRGSDSSTAAQSAGVATPAAAQSPLGLTATATSGTNVNLAWTNGAGATSNQIFRSVGAGAFTLLATVGATAATFSDTTVVAGTSYSYRVDAVNWAGSTQSAVSLPVVPQAPAVLVAPTGLTASAATNPALNWVDQSTGETAYRVRRTAYTVGTTGAVTVGAVTTLSSTVASAAAPATDGARTFTDAAGVVNATVLYDAAALSGASVGPLATVFDVAGGMQTANRPTLTRTNATARVTVTWTAPGNAAAQASIGGYEVQRCTGLTCTTFAKVPGAAVNTAGTVDGRGTLTFVDNTVARATGYTYRMRTVGGTGTGLLGAFSPTAIVSTN